MSKNEAAVTSYTQNGLLLFTGYGQVRKLAALF